MMNKICRQHEATHVIELRGKRCFIFQAVYSVADKKYGPFYLKAAETWHRFYLDAGLLFWEEGIAPDLEDDLFEGDEYVDLGEFIPAVGSIITRIEMADGILVMQFEKGPTLEFKTDVEEVGALRIF